MLKLISATPSPFARKVRVALMEKDIPFDLITVNPWNANERVHPHNPLGKIPVLITDTGKPIYESSYILDWLEVHFPEPALIPKDKEKALEAKYFQVVSDGICEAFVLLFIERLRAVNKRSHSWEDRQFEKIDRGMSALEAMTPKSGFCVGGIFTLADIAVVSTVEYLALRFEEYEFNEKCPKLLQFVDEHKNRPSFKNTRPQAQKLNKDVV